MLLGLLKKTFAGHKKESLFFYGIFSGDNTTDKFLLKPYEHKVVSDMSTQKYFYI